MKIYIRYAVYSYREGLRWYFKSTNSDETFLFSLNLKDIKLLFKGIYLLIPPFKTSHIRGIW